MLALYNHLFACRRILVMMLFCTWAATGAWARDRVGYQMANQVAVANRGCLLAVCGDINNPQHAVDTDTLTAAEITSPLALSAATLRVKFATMALAGHRAGVALSAPAGLNLSALENVRVRTYLGNNPNPVQDFSASSLLTVASLSNQVTMVRFAVTAPFDQLEVRVAGALTASYSVREYYAETFNPNAPLPVTLTAFAAKEQAGAVALTWQTASERNADYFVVERAQQAGGPFVAAGQVVAQGMSSRPLAYGFSDAEATRNSPATLYYRLRQVDRDGQFDFSPVVVVALRGGNAPGLTAYPNPAQPGQAVQVHWAGAAGQWLRVYGLRGDLLYQTPAELAGTTLPTNTLAPGVYLVVLAAENGSAVARQRLVVEVR